MTNKMITEDIYCITFRQVVLNWYERTNSKWQREYEFRYADIVLPCAEVDWLNCKAWAGQSEPFIHILITSWDTQMVTARIYNLASVILKHRPSQTPSLPPAERMQVPRWIELCRWWRAYSMSKWLVNKLGCWANGKWDYKVSRPLTLWSTKCDVGWLICPRFFQV